MFEESKREESFYRKLSVKTEKYPLTLLLGGI